MKRKFSDGMGKKLYSFLMNCTAPLLTVVFVAGSACWAAELQYGEPDEYYKNPEAVNVLSEKGLSVRTYEHTETAMPVYELAAENNENAENNGAELVEACGIYIGDEFVGAVTDGESIEQELSKVLEDYREDENIIEADFEVEPDLKQGLYRTEALVDEQEMTDFLTGDKKVISEYTAEKEDTPEKIAEDFGMSVEEVKALNPEIDEIENGEQIKVKETVSVLPVKYVCEEQQEEVIEIESLSGNDDYELVPGGVIGKKTTTFNVTYIDGNEISRKIKSTETVELEPDLIKNIIPDDSDYETEIPDEKVIEEDTAAQQIQEDETQPLYSESVPETENSSYESFIWPVNGGYISDTFISDRNHKGLDIAAPAGTDIYASDGGTVLEAGWNDGGYGNYVIIDHGNGYITLYGHASEVFVSAGEVVSQGQLIAAVGTTGDSTGNHCHFEVRYNGEFLNPQDFI